jgi:hypothetical protein
MDKQKNRNFIHKTESLVKPEDVTAISFLGDFNKILPLKTQHRIMEKGNKVIPYMGFIVEPYCFFISYRIKDLKAAEAMLPDEYEIAETTMFDKEKPYPMVVVCAFSVRTSAFIGTRLEFYIIARHKETGMISWIISDYETNTNSHDPKYGFTGYTSDPTVFTTTPYGELITHFKSRKRPLEFKVSSDITKGKMEKLNADLWVEGNLSIEYGGELKDDASKPFSLIFDPYLMKEALDVPLKHVEVQLNSYLSTLIDGMEPERAAIFPYAQHFIIKQDLQKHELRKEEQLEPYIQGFLDAKDFKTMKGDDIKKPLLRSMAISSIFNISLILFLLYLVIFR